MELFCKLRGNNILITQASSNDRRDFLMNILKKKYERHSWSESYEDNIKSLIRNFSVILVRKWRASNSTFNMFAKKNALWLQKQFEIPNQYIKKIKEKVGRQRKLFTESSIRGKQRKSSAIGKICKTPVITFVVKSKLYKSGKRTLAKLLEEGASTPKIGLKMKKALKTKKVIPFSPQEALAFILDNKLPLQLQCVNNNEKIVLWSNPRYSSTRFCRPLKFIFMKESIMIKQSKCIQKLKMKYLD